MSVSELRTTAAPEKIPTAAELVGRARTLAPKLRERALKAERDRNVPRESVRNIPQSISPAAVHQKMRRRPSNPAIPNQPSSPIRIASRRAGRRFPRA